MSDAIQDTLQPAVKLVIGDQTFSLRFDFESVAEAEEIVNRSLITGLQVSDITAPKARLVQAMFFAAAHYDQPSLTFVEAKKLVTRKNLPDIWVKVFEAWTASNPEPEEQTATDPTQAQS